MQSPGAAIPRSLNLAAPILEIGYKHVLSAVITQSETEVMGKCRQIDFKVDWKRFFKCGHRIKCLASPAGTGSEHRQYNSRLIPHTQIAKKTVELYASSVTKVMGMTGFINPSKMVSQNIGVVGLQELDLTLVEVFDQRKMIEFK